MPTRERCSTRPLTPTSRGEGPARGSAEQEEAASVTSRAQRRARGWHCGLCLQPLGHALKPHVLACPVVRANETPVAMLSLGSGKAHARRKFVELHEAYKSTAAVAAIEASCTESSAR